MTTDVSRKPSTPAPPPSPTSNFLSSAKRGLGQSGIFIAFLAILASVRDPHQGHHSHPAEHLQPGGAEQLHPDPGHRHGHRDHRRTHRSVGRVGRRIHRRAGRRLHRPDGPTGLAGCAAGPRYRRRRRRLAGILGRLLRHSRLHRHAGRNAHLPRRHHAGAEQQADLALPGQLPEHFRGLRRRTRRVRRGSRVPRRRRGRPVHPAPGCGLRGGADLDPGPHQSGQGEIPPERRVPPALSSPAWSSPVWRSCTSSCSCRSSRDCRTCCSSSRSSSLVVLRRDEPLGLRSACVRHRRQSARRRTVRHQGQAGDLLGLRQHGSARRAGRHRVRRPAQPGEPHERHGPSNSTPSPRRSSAAPRSPAVSAG